MFVHARVCFRKYCFLTCWQLHRVLWHKDGLKSVRCLIYLTLFLSLLLLCHFDIVCIVSALFRATYKLFVEELFSGACLCKTCLGIFPWQYQTPKVVLYDNDTRAGSSVFHVAHLPRFLASLLLSISVRWVAGWTCLLADGVSTSDRVIVRKTKIQTLRSDQEGPYISKPPLLLFYSQIKTKKEYY